MTAQIYKIFYGQPVLFFSPLLKKKSADIDEFDLVEQRRVRDHAQFLVAFGPLNLEAKINSYIFVSQIQSLIPE